MFMMLGMILCLLACGQKPSQQQTKTAMEPTKTEAPEGYEGAETPKPVTDLGEDCYEPVNKDASSPCPDLYDPICGCDNKNYSNPCQAKKAGIKKWTKGTCE